MRPLAVILQKALSVLFKKALYGNASVANDIAL